MADEEIHRLVVAFEARQDKFGELVVKTQEDFAKALGAMERRQEQFGRTIARHAERTGREFASKLMGGIATALSFAAVENFVSAQLENAARVRKQATTLGLSTDAVQAFSIISDKSGIDPAELDRGLDKFATNLGESKLKATEFGRVLHQLGVDTHGTVEEVFYRFIDVLNKVGDVTQRDAVLAAALGGKNVSMASFIAQGSAAIRQQTEDLKKNGEIIGEDVLGKIDAMGAAWIGVKAQLTTIGANVLSGFAGELHTITGDLKDTAFQTSLANFGKIMADVAGYIVKMGPYLPAMAVLMAAGRGPVGLGLATGTAIAGGAQAHGFDLKRFLLETVQIPLTKADLFAAQHGARLGGPSAGDLQKTLAAQEAELAWRKGQRNPDGSGRGIRDQFYTPADPLGAAAGQPPPPKSGKGIDLSGSLTPHHKTEAEAAAEDIVKHGNEELARIAAEVQGLGLSAGQIAALTYIAESKARIKDAKGVYGGKLKTDVESTARDIQLATDKRDAGKLDQDTITKADALIAKYGEQTEALGLTAGAGERLAFVQERLNAAAAQHIVLSAEEIDAIHRQADAVGHAGDQAEDAHRQFERAQSATQTLRDGVETVGTAGLRGFGALKSAAAGFAMQLAEMILKLEVLEPLMNAAFGQPGQVGKGAIGSAMFSPQGGFTGGNILSTVFSSIGSFFGFADGGVMTPQGPRRLPRFAGGGVSNTPGIFGEAGPEAAVPLSGGRFIPVQMRMPRIPSASELRRTTSNVSFGGHTVIIQGNTDDASLARLQQILDTHKHEVLSQVPHLVSDMADRRSGPWNHL